MKAYKKPQNRVINISTRSTFADFIISSKESYEQWSRQQETHGEILEGETESSNFHPYTSWEGLD